MNSAQRTLMKTVFAGAMLPVCASAHAGTFTYTPLVLPGSTGDANVTGIYQDKAIGFGGTKKSPKQNVSFVWSNGAYTLITGAYFYGVSDIGVAVGADANSKTAYATYDLTTGKLQTGIAVNLPPNENVYVVTGINASGTIVALGEALIGKSDQFQPLEQDVNGNLTLLHKFAKHSLYPVGISDAGVVAFQDAIYKNGKIKKITPPLNDYLLQIDDINSQGLFGGNYVDKNTGEAVGFTSSGGSKTVYTQPGWGNVAVTGVGGHGEIVGYYIDTSEVWHGFIYQKGVYSTIDYPGSFGTLIQGVGSDGSIIGYYTAVQSQAMYRPGIPFIAVCKGGGACTQ